MTDSASAFAASLQRLLHQVRHWEGSRWAVGQRAFLAYALVQHLADLGADAEDRPRRPVPREHDLILPDQLRVVADDLFAAAPDEPILAGAARAVDVCRAAL